MSCFEFSTKDKKLNFRASGMTGTGSFVGLELNFRPIPEGLYSSVGVYINEDTQPDELIYGSYNYMNDGCSWHRTAIITTEEHSVELSEFKKHEMMTEKVRTIAKI